MRKNMLIIDSCETDAQRLEEEFRSRYAASACNTNDSVINYLFKYHAMLSVILINNIQNIPNGLAMLSQIHSNPFFSRIPVFVLSDLDDDSIRNSCYELGVMHYWVAPITFEHIAKVMENAVRFREWASFENSFYKEVVAIEETDRRELLLNDSSASVSVCNIKTHELLYVNGTCAKMCGNDVEKAVGQPCYSYLRGRNTPCEDCYIYKVNSEDFTKLEYSDIRNGRHLVIRAKLINWDGKAALVKYVSDETDSINLRLKLLASHRALDAASNTTGVAFWMYDIDNKVADWGDFISSPYAGYPNLMENMPDSMIDNGCVHPEDAKKFLDMYKELEAGAETCECSVRLLNQTTKRYNCFHTVYTRLHDTYYSTRKAVGFAENVDLQNSYKAQYDKELQLRNEIIRDAVLYYEVDLTEGMLIEYQSKISDVPSMKSNVLMSEEMKADILKRVFVDDREYVSKNLFSNSLLKAYNNGRNSLELIYRRHVGNDEIHWVKDTITIMQRPDGHSIVAFICLHDINDIETDRIALSSAITEGVESLSVISVKTGMAHLIKTSHDLNAVKNGNLFNHDESMETVIKTRVIEADRERCAKFFYVNSLIKSLTGTSSVDITYSIKEVNGYLRRKRSTAFYLNEFHTDIVLIRRDITSIYEEDQRQKAVLKAAADAANEANKAKGEFLSRMSHDMRTPMNAIIGMTYLAKQEETSEKVTELLNNIDMSSHYLLGLINDVLDLSKIESGSTTLKEEEFTLAEFTQGVDTVIRPLMEAKNIDFEFHVDCSIRNIITDKLRFNQIFYNLLTNASKYTGNGGKVKFTVEHIPDKDGLYGMRARVKDNGIGMSKDFLKVIFKPFTQEHNPALAEQQGTGLGLAIVKNLVSLMGGTIAVSSTLGKGTEFIIDLYVRNAKEIEYKKEKVSVDYSALKGIKILLVDDNDMNIIVARKLLEQQKCIIITAKDGVEAVEKFEESEIGYYDAILMDVRMPKMNGLEATKKIRSFDRADSKMVPIIAMTADAFSEATENTKDAGMNEHLTKPVEPDVMFSTIVKFTK